MSASTQCVTFDKEQACDRCPCGYMNSTDEPHCGYYGREIGTHVLPAEKPTWCKVLYIYVDETRS